MHVKNIQLTHRQFVYYSKFSGHLLRGYLRKLIPETYTLKNGVVIILNRKFGHKLHMHISFEHYLKKNDL